VLGHALVVVSDAHLGVAPPDVEERLLVFLEAVPALGGANPISRLVGDYAQQPGTGRRTGPESVQRAVCLHEPVLGGVFGLGGRSGDHVGGPEGDLLVMAHDLLIGGRIPALGACKQLGIVLRPALHRNVSSTPATPRWFRLQPSRRRVCLGE
jgi:hypothetical protein